MDDIVLSEQTHPWETMETYQSSVQKKNSEPIASVEANSDAPIPSSTSVSSSISSIDEFSDEEEGVVCSPPFRFWRRRKTKAFTLINDGPDAENNDLFWTSCSPRKLRSSKDEKKISPSKSWLSLDVLNYTAEEMELSDRLPTYESDLSRLRPIFVVTTAALPWMTGTAVNPLLRAAYLARRQAEQDPKREPTVALVVPWLESEVDRVTLYGEEWKDATPETQEIYIRHWLETRAGFPGVSLSIVWYTARYHSTLSSIFAMGDIFQHLDVPDDAACVLEEPEHLNFYRVPGKDTWRGAFSHVVGIIHTNYKAYASHHYSGVVTGPLVGALSSWCVRASCDRVIKLSSVLQYFCAEKEITCNVHGIRQEFLDVPAPCGNKVYFLGKMLWAKGLDKILSLQHAYKKQKGDFFPMDIYGSGPEQAEIQQAFLGETDDDNASVGSKSSLFKFVRSCTPLPVQFLGRVDHAAVSPEYKVFVNPSITEVLCTSTAEAVAMGKFVVIPKHNSNIFFEQFPNCFMYTNKSEFIEAMSFVLFHRPVPLSEEQRYVLTWEAATGRFLESGEITVRDAARNLRVGRKLDDRIDKVQSRVFQGPTGDILRKMMGGGPVADQFKYEKQLRQRREDPS